MGIGKDHLRHLRETVGECGFNCRSVGCRLLFERRGWPSHVTGWALVGTAGSPCLRTWGERCLHCDLLTDRCRLHPHLVFQPLELLYTCLYFFCSVPLDRLSAGHFACLSFASSRGSRLLIHGCDKACSRTDSTMSDSEEALAADETQMRAFLPASFGKKDKEADIAAQIERSRRIVDNKQAKKFG